MLFVPLPFVVAALLIVLFGIAVRSPGEGPRNLPLLALILLCSLLCIFSGLRWGYGVRGMVSYLAPLCAAAGPPLAYAGVIGLTRGTQAALRRRLAVHSLPPWPFAVDLALVAIFVAYAVAILLLMRPGTDALRLASFEEAGPAYRGILFAALALLCSACIDAFVFVDLTWLDGSHSPPAIAFGNLASLVVLSVAAATASRSRTKAESGPALASAAPAEDRETLAAVATLMATKRVYRDSDLTLDRLARKLGMPARQISAAINRATGKNVSQYVNEYRIAEACALLAGSDRPVTEIIFAVGFQTKSNFNREFRRVTGISPLAWRERTAQPTRIAIEHDR